MLEELKRDLQGKVEELQEENDHLRRQNMMESEAKSRLRQEASQLTADNMVCVDLKARRVTASVCKCLCNKDGSKFFFFFQDFEEQLDHKDRLIKKLQNQIKSLETSHKGRVMAFVCLFQKYIYIYIHNFSMFIALSSLTAKHTAAPTTPKDYLGMLEYKRTDESKLIQNIILGTLALFL